MNQRVLAIIGALGIVVLALVVRAQLADDGDTRPGDQVDRGSNDRPTVACTPDLATVCDALVAAGKIRPADDDVDLSSGDELMASVDGWITWDPAPSIGNIASDQAGDGIRWDGASPLGSSQRAVMLEPISKRLLNETCSTITWGCLAAAASEDFSIGVGNPATSEGIARLAPLARALAPDGDYQRLDGTQLQALVDSPPDGQSDALTMAGQKAVLPAAVSVVVGPYGLLDATAKTVQGRGNSLAATAPSPKGSLTVVVTRRHGADLSGTGSWCKEAADALRALGVTPCTGRSDDSLAGFLFQVQKKVS